MPEDHQTHPVCPWWFTYTFDNPLRRRFHDTDLLFAGRIVPGMRCLDIGCGFGYFAAGMAPFLGVDGRVLAVDLQRRMLDRVEKRARKSGYEPIIQTRLCDKHSLRVGPAEGDAPFDFALAFWSAHEVPDQRRLFHEVHDALRPGGRFLLVEPRLDVGRRYFTAEIERVEGAGFRVEGCPQVAFSIAAQFVRL